MRQILRRKMRTQNADGPLAIATGVGQDSHCIGLHMVSDILRTDGWQIHMLSTSERGVLGQAIKAFPGAKALLLSIGYAEVLPVATRLVSHARREGFQGLVAIGGRGVMAEPKALAITGADLTGLNGLDLLQQLRRGRHSADTSPDIPVCDLPESSLPDAELDDSSPDQRDGESLQIEAA